MKFLFVFLLSFGFICEALGQSALDPNCYQPRIGIEIDTIYGSEADQQLGNFIWNTGVPANGNYGKVLISGMPDNAPFLSAIEGGPNFNLHKVFKNSTKLNVNFPGIAVYRHQVGHFRDSKHIDVLADVSDDDFYIYWADDEGNYDSSRRTRLRIPPKTGFGSGFEMKPPYVDYLSSDTVEDIIQTILYAPNFGVDTNAYHYLVQYKGGDSLYQKKIAYFDTSVFLGVSNSNLRQFGRLLYASDFDGNSRKDIIAFGGDRVGSSNVDNLFYYQSSKPFSLDSLAHSLFYDTLFAQWQNPSVNGFGDFGNMISPSLCFGTDIRPADLLLTFNWKVPRNESVLTNYVYYGGPEFGKHRIYADSADFIFHSPDYYDGSFPVHDLGPTFIIGDITGTGHNTLYWDAGRGAFESQLFYVFGKGQDDKADMFYEYENGWVGMPDTITADGDDLSDVMLGCSKYVTPEDLAINKQLVGTLHLIHGSKKIPVHTNSVDIQKQFDTSANHILAIPNPCDEKTVLTFDNCNGAVMTMDVYDSRGNRCIREETPIVQGMQQYACDLHTLAAGVYYIRLTCPSDGWSATASVIKTGAAQAQWKLDLHELVK